MEGTARNVPKTGCTLFEVSRTVIGYGGGSFSGTIRGCRPGATKFIKEKLKTYLRGLNGKVIVEYLIKKEVLSTYSMKI